MDSNIHAVQAFITITRKPKLGAIVEQWLQSDRNTGLLSVLNSCRNEGLDEETAIRALEETYRVYDEGVGASENKMTSHPLEIRRAADKVYGEHFAIAENRPHPMVTRGAHVKTEVVFGCLSRWGEANFLSEDTSLMREFCRWGNDVSTTLKRLEPECNDDQYDCNTCAKNALSELFDETDKIVCGPCTSQPVSLPQALKNIDSVLPDYTSTCTYGENRKNVRSIKYVLLEWDCQLDGNGMPEDWMANDGIEKRSLVVSGMTVILPKDTAIMTFSFLAKFREMGIPVKAVTWSGGKSLHCLIPVEPIQITDGNKEGTKQLVKTLRTAIQWLGCDSSCVSWNRLTRLPFGWRHETRDRLCNDTEGNVIVQMAALYNDMKPIKIEELEKKMSDLAEEIKGSGDAVVFQETSYITVDELDRWLVSHDKYIATNMLTGKNEYVGWPSCYDQENVILQTIRDELRIDGQKPPSELLASVVNSVAARYAFHPVRDYLESLTWDGMNRISMMLVALGIDSKVQPLQATMVRKWLLQAVAAAYNDGKRSFEHVLTLVGPQGCGKTTFFRMLVPEAFRTEWFREGQSVNMDDKDSIRIATSSWITELGEVDDMLKREQTALKAFLSSTNDTSRDPYALKAMTRPRWTVFGATVNSMTFLNDQTGNRRWWTVCVDGMDVDLVRILAQCIDQVWAQVKAMWDNAVREGKAWSCFRLTDEESRELEVLNATHTSIDPLLMLINESFDWDALEEQWRDITGTEVCRCLNITNQTEKRKFLSALRDETNRRGIRVRRTGNREKWCLPPFSQGAGISYWR